MTSQSKRGKISVALTAGQRWMVKGMAEYFAGGHLRFVQGEWRDDNGNPVEIERVRHGRWEEATEPLGWNDVTVASCSVCGDSWVLDEFTIDEYAKWHQYCSSCGAKIDGYITMPDTEFASDEE